MAKVKICRSCDLPWVEKDSRYALKCPACAFKEDGFISDAMRNEMELKRCQVKCPACKSIWQTSLGAVFCCLGCNYSLNTNDHVVVNSENEVN